MAIRFLTFAALFLSLGASNAQDAGTTQNIPGRFETPPGFFRTAVEEGSFAAYLRMLPLKPEGVPVLTHTGALKSNQQAHAAVVDLPIGSKDLHQCADALIRLRAEYLYGQKRFNEIKFNFTSGFEADYASWMQGKRITVDGNRAFWRTTAAPSNTYKDFWSYLETIFTYAGTLSLAQELAVAPWSKLEPGDILIQGGSPGHAVIVIDKCKNERTGRTLFMLAQSYMPAQEIHVLKNLNDEALSPWYDLADEIIHTPEWQFKSADLKRFR